MKNILQYIYTGWCGIMFVIPMIVFLPFMAIPIIISRRLLSITYFFIRVWVYWFGYTTGIIFKGHNKHIVKKDQSYIFVINHTSFLDAPAIPIAIPAPLVALGKKELSKIPIFGWLTGRWAIWVDRSDPESRKEGSAKLKEILKGGTSVLVAPEGTRNNTDEPLLPFRYGPFRLAVESQISIIPVIIHDAGKLMKRGSLLLRPGRVNCYCLPEVSVEGKTEDDIEELTQSTYELMRNKILEMNTKN